jgi:sn-glycerol 3-phosphate transport system ATP-binding protein
MDEPLSNLDAQLRHEMRREIRALQQKLGITMIYVTHDQTEAMSMADQVVLLRGGCIEQHDTPDQLYARPRTEFAARFIGTPPMNLLRLSDDGARIAGCAAPLAEALHGVRARKLGVRPEHISLVTEGGVEARVEGVEYFGADTIVVCAVGENTGITLRAAGHLRAAPGEPIRLAWLPRNQHFFDASGLAIEAGS